VYDFQRELSHERELKQETNHARDLAAIAAQLIKNAKKEIIKQNNAIHNGTSEQAHQCYSSL